MNAPIGDPADPLVATVDAWAQASPRFAAFVAANSSKIRKKIRTAGDDETRADVRFELTVARALLLERRIALLYEPLGLGRQRGPDFGATFRTNLPFGVEATRLRAAHRFADAVSAKLAQLLPQQSNLLALGSDEPPDDLAAAMAQIRLRAERRDAQLFGRSGMRDPAEFFKYWARLSALAVLPLTPAGPAAAIWHNPQARHPLPNDLRAALERCLAAPDAAA
jgi:hypothetical protein